MSFQLFSFPPPAEKKAHIYDKNQFGNESCCASPTKGLGGFPRTVHSVYLLSEPGGLKTVKPTSLDCMKPVLFVDGLDPPFGRQEPWVAEPVAFRARPVAARRLEFCRCELVPDSELVESWLNIQFSGAMSEEGRDGFIPRTRHGQPYFTACWAVWIAARWPGHECVPFWNSSTIIRHILANPWFSALITGSIHGGNC